MNRNQQPSSDLEALWKTMAQEKFENNKLEKTKIMNAINKQSTDDIILLKKRLGIKILWCILFIVIMVALMLLNLDKFQFLMIMGFAVGIYILGGGLLVTQYLQMDSSDKDDSVLQVMKHNLKTIKKALQIETIWGMFLLPLSIPIGMLLPRTYNGEMIQELIHDTRYLMVGLCLIIFVVPLMTILTNKMNKSAFGCQISSLEENIIKMETLS